MSEHSRCLALILMGPPQRAILPPEFLETFALATGPAWLENRVRPGLKDPAAKSLASAANLARD